MPISASSRISLINIQTNLSSARAESHSNSDLARPTCNGISHDAVKSDRGEECREETKHGRERGHQALSAQRAVDFFVERSHTALQTCGRPASMLLTHSPKSPEFLRGIAICAHICAHAVDKIDLQVWPVKLHRNLFADAFIFRIPHHTDNRDVRDCAGVAAHSDPLSDGVGVAEIAFDEFLIDDGHLRRRSRIVLGKAAPRQNGNADNGKEIRSHIVHVGADVFAGFGIVPYTRDRTIPFISIEERDDSHGSAPNPGQRIGPVDEFPIELDGVGVRVPVARGIHAEREQAIRVEARIGVLQIPKGTDERPCARSAATTRELPEPSREPCADPMAPPPTTADA